MRLTTLRLLLTDGRHFDIMSSKWDLPFEELKMSKQEFYRRGLDKRGPDVMSFITDADFVYGDERDGIDEEIGSLSQQVADALIAEERLYQLKRKRNERGKP